MSAFDLDKFAPAPTRFTLRGRDYQVDGDPDVDTVARMLRIEEKIGGSSTPDEMAAALQEGRDVLLELVRERDPEVAELKIGSQQLLVVFSLIVHGPSVADAVAAAIAPPTPAPGEAGKAVATGDAPAREATADADAAPLASEPSSPESSYGSDGETAGALVTGTA